MSTTLPIRRPGASKSIVKWGKSHYIVVKFLDDTLPNLTR